VDSGVNGEVRVKVFMRGSVQKYAQGALHRFALLAEKKPPARALENTRPGSPRPETGDKGWRQAIGWLATGALVGPETIAPNLRNKTFASMGNVCRRSTISATDCRTARTLSCVALRMIT
jgi:hypothetical protein